MSKTIAVNYQLRISHTSKKVEIPKGKSLKIGRIDFVYNNKDSRQKTMITEENKPCRSGDLCFDINLINRNYD